MNNRREFLKSVAMLGAAATLPTFALAQEKAADPRFVVRYNQIKRKASKPRKISIPNVEGFQTLKGDFHIHTLFSDGHVMPKDRVAEAVENGLDVIALTQHIEHRPNIGTEPL